MNRGIFLLLGSNIGDRQANLTIARHKIQYFARIVRQSAVYKTAPWGKPDQPDFYNQVVEVDTSLNAEELLTHLLSIEKDMGRKREERWGSRIIDIDLLFYQNIVLSGDNVTVPHPGIPDRRFALVPLHEIAPDFPHPVLGKTVSALLHDCPDTLDVTRLEMTVTP